MCESLRPQFLDSIDKEIVYWSLSQHIYQLVGHMDVEDLIGPQITERVIAMVLIIVITSLVTDRSSLTLVVFFLVIVESASGSQVSTRQEWGGQRAREASWQLPDKP